MIAWKTRYSITFTSLIQLEQVKAFYVDKKVVCKKKKFISSFCGFLFLHIEVCIELWMA